MSEENPFLEFYKRGGYLDDARPSKRLNRARYESQTFSDGGSVLDQIGAAVAKPFEAAWGYLPPEARRSYKSLATLAGELSPGAAVRDTVDASGELGKAALKGDAGGLASSTINILTAMAGLVPAGKLAGKVGNEAVDTIRAYHGTPHNFDKFDASKIGTGEGAQVYGHGLYFAGNESTAKTYRDAVTNRLSPTRAIEDMNKEWQAAITQNPKSRPHVDDIAEEMSRVPALKPYIGDPEVVDGVTRYINGWNPNSGTVSEDALRAIRLLKSKIPEPKGHMYEVNIGASPSKLLDYDVPVHQQSRDVLDALDLRQTDTSIGGGARLYSNTGNFWLQDRPDRKLKDVLPVRSPNFAKTMTDLNIPGIQYLDQFSRGASGGSRNYVIFPGNEHLINIVRKYGLIPVTAGGAVIAGTTLPSEGDVK